MEHIDFPVLIPILASIITVFGALLIFACLFSVQPAPVRRRVRR